MSDEIDIHEAVSVIQYRLDERASTPERPYWLIKDHGETYCLDCIKAMKPKAKYGTFYDGGFSSESDHAEHCEGCGKLLEYTLTDYGVEQELAHFEEMGFFWNVKDECYELARIAYGVSTHEQRKRLLQVVAESAHKPDDAA